MRDKFFKIMTGSASRTKNSILNLATSLGGQLLTTVLKFVTRTVFIHTLGKSYLGIAGLFSDILSMLSLTELGLGTAINFQMYKPLAEHDAHRVRVLLNFYKQAYRVIGATILILGLCLIPALPVLIRDYASLAPLGINAALVFVLFLLQSVSSYMFFAYRSTVMSANQKQYILDVANYVIVFATNAVQILILVFLKDFVLYVATVIVFNILRNLVNAVIAKRYYPSFFKKESDSLDRKEVRGLFKDCGALFIYKVNGVVLKATDNIVLSSFIGLTAVGLYSNYLLFYSTITALLGKFYTSVKASMGNLFATEDTDKKYKFFQVMNYLSAVLYGTAAVGVAVCSNELISVWVGNDYVIPQPFPILIGIEILFVGIKNNLGQIRNVSGVFQQMWYSPLLGIIINLGVSIALVQICDVYGVIIGTIVTAVLTDFLIDPRVIHKFSLQNYRPVSEYYRKNLLYFTVLAAVCAADLWLCGHVFIGWGWFSVIVHALIVAVTVPGVCFLLFWSSEEFQYLYSLSKKTLKKIGRMGARPR